MTINLKLRGEKSNFQDETELHHRKTNFRSLQYHNTGVLQAYQPREHHKSGITTFWCGFGDDTGQPTFVAPLAKLT